MITNMAHQPPQSFQLSCEAHGLNACFQSLLGHGAPSVAAVPTAAPFGGPLLPRSPGSCPHEPLAVIHRTKPLKSRLGQENL